MGREPKTEDQIQRTLKNFHFLFISQLYRGLSFINLLQNSANKKKKEKKKYIVNCVGNGKSTHKIIRKIKGRSWNYRKRTAG